MVSMDLSFRASRMCCHGYRQLGLDYEPIEVKKASTWLKFRRSQKSHWYRFPAFCMLRCMDDLLIQAPISFRFALKPAILEFERFPLYTTLFTQINVRFKSRILSSSPYNAV